MRTTQLDQNMGNLEGPHIHRREALERLISILDNVQSEDVVLLLAAVMRRGLEMMEKGLGDGRVRDDATAVSACVDEMCRLEESKVATLSSL